MSVLSQKHFHDEEAAYAYVEARLWPDGPVCPRCGETERVGKLKGKSTRPGVHKCYKCRKPFTVKIGTVFEDSKVPMHYWLQAIYMMAASKKGISANQLHRTLGVQIRTAWFMAHRIREAMRTGELEPMGGPGKVVEADETFIGKKKDTPKGRGGYAHKQVALALVERSGPVRTFHIDKARTKDIQPIVEANIDRETMLMTDEATYYRPIGKGYKHHFTVDHGSGEFVRGSVHTNTLEGYFSIFKRGMKGVYQHCSEKHLHRYLAEFEFRYNNRVATGVNDELRAERALCAVVGKRLFYRDSLR